MGGQPGAGSLGRQASQWIGIYVKVRPSGAILADDLDAICDAHAGRNVHSIDNKLIDSVR